MHVPSADPLAPAHHADASAPVSCGPQRHGGHPDERGRGTYSRKAGGGRARAAPHPTTAQAGAGATGAARPRARFQPRSGFVTRKVTAQADSNGSRTCRRGRGGPVSVADFGKLRLFGCRADIHQTLTFCLHQASSPRPSHNVLEPRRLVVKKDVRRFYNLLIPSLILHV